MKLAVDTFSYYMHFGKHWYTPKNPVDIRWYCKLSKQMGLDGLHIDPYHIDLKDDTEWVRNFAEANGMYIELGASGTAVDELRPYIETAKKLNANLLRTFVGGSCLEGRTAASERAKKAKKQLEKSVLLAEKKGIRIAVENHGDIFIEDMLTLLKIDSEFLGVCYDSGNFAFTGENPLDAIRVMGVDDVAARADHDPVSGRDRRNDCYCDVPAYDQDDFGYDVNAEVVHGFGLRVDVSGFIKVN